ncbi:MAG: class I SAM-dependent methyltransferase [Bacillota bacterium]|nr:class I SAM-dependent methyltransferase [Bacillota bacterium]
MLEEFDKEIIKSDEDILVMLDNLLEYRGGQWWDDFYSNKERNVPFFKGVPDENLISYVRSGIFKPGRILDIGCGNGRNSIYLAKLGFQVDAVDFSEASIEWAREVAAEEKVHISFYCQSIFDFELQTNYYDYIYDAGCLHHIKPHRRKQYLQIIYQALKPEGYFALTCFKLKGGANVSDYDVYRDRSMHGGLGFSEHKLRAVLEPYFEFQEFREMKEITDGSMFGKDFCWALLLGKKGR